MKIVVFIGGSITNGFDSPTSGESRWAQNLAKMLAERGHEVDVVANSPSDPPSWGSSKPMSNVTLHFRPNPSKLYDLALYIPWEHQYNGPRWETCHSLPVTAKYYIHCTFSWTNSLPDHDCWKRNHILAYPYIQEDSQFKLNADKNPFPTFPLPYPIFDTVADIDIAQRKDIVWACKDVFHPGWKNNGSHVPRIGMDALQCVKDLSNEFDFNFHVLSTRFFDPRLSDISAQCKPLDFVRTIRNSHIYELIPKNQLQDIFKKSRLNVIISGLFGSFGESITMGCAPLCYNGHIYRAAAEECGIKLDEVQVSKERLYEVMRKLYTDDAFYTKYVLACRREMRYYSFDESYKYFLEMVKQLGF
jgi:hypothetical protein